MRSVAFSKAYDSLLCLSKKHDQFDYPINVEKTVCELVKPHGAVEITVEDVQQQVGNDDCGLFAIAFATALVSNIDPNSL